jgi:hypothetical protein
MADSELLNTYYHWLCRGVDIGPEYSKLSSYLFDYPFRWCHDHDAQRATDGRDLRYYFGCEVGINDYIDIGRSDWVSVLEVLVAFSKRIELQVMGDDELGDRTATWFWDMMRNLSLTRMTNDAFDVNVINQILDVWLDRKFQSDGKFSPFPLDQFGPKSGPLAQKSGPNDQRLVDMWYQMQTYMMQKY